MYKRSLSKLVFLLTALFLVGILILSIQHLRAKPNLYGFDPSKMGKMESAMWRSYYEGKWIQLGWQSMRVASTQFQYSWWDSARMAYYAAKSALYFRKDSSAPECLPALNNYYKVIEAALKIDFDTNTAARLELQWWRERRIPLQPKDYAKTIAQLTELVYRLPEGQAYQASTLRAEAMAYRDARRNGKMTTKDWQEVTRQLELSYTALASANRKRP